MASFYYEPTAGQQLPWAPGASTWRDGDIERFAAEAYQRNPNQPFFFKNVATGMPMTVYGGRVMMQSGPIDPWPGAPTQPMTWSPGVAGLLGPDDNPWVLAGIAAVLYYLLK